MNNDKLNFQLNKCIKHKNKLLIKKYPYKIKRIIAYYVFFTNLQITNLQIYTTKISLVVKSYRNGPLTEVRIKLKLQSKSIGCLGLC